MARIPPVTRDRVREDLQSIFDEVSSGPGGVGTGPMSVLKYSPERGDDGGKKVPGRQRHILVDTLGFLITALMTSAGLDDGRAAPQLLALISATAFPRLVMICGDNKYHHHDLQAWMATHRPTWRLEVTTRPEGSRGFTPLRKRWVVERTNAWNDRDRRNSKDYERKPASSAVMMQMSHIHLMLNRLAPCPGPAFRYRQKVA